MRLGHEQLVAMVRRENELRMADLDAYDSTGDSLDLLNQVTDRIQAQVAKEFGCDFDVYCSDLNAHRMDPQKRELLAEETGAAFLKFDRSEFP